MSRGIEVDLPGRLVWESRELEIPAGAWLLMPDTADFIERVLLHYRDIPALFDKYRLRHDTAWRKVIPAIVNEAVARERLRVEQEEQRWPTWLWVVTLCSVGAGMLLVGFVGGVIAD